MNEMLVALNGKLRSGKTTTAQGMVGEYGFTIISIGSTIKKVSTLLIDDQIQLKKYLKNVLKGEDTTQFESIFQELVTTFQENYQNADWVKDENGVYQKNEWYRKLTQYVATYFRDLYSEDIWMRFIAADAMELAEQGKRVVCDDLRLPSEKRILEMFGFVTIRLDISEAEQQRRLKKENETIPEDLLNHPTEVALDDATFDLRFLTDEMSIEEVNQKVYEFLKL